MYNPPFCAGFSSFPDWSTLGEIREIELERGNYFPDVNLDMALPTKWLAVSKLIAYSYVVLACESDRVLRGELTDDELKNLDNSVFEIPLQKGDVCITEDGDGGYLIVRGGNGHRDYPETSAKELKNKLEESKK